ncbi:FecR family protein [Roseibium suaedae]|uniref:FecR family protein n=1 Tax=Roseibium suaedae TaxID=735517 RepID=A0A1M7L957_9HYPH|nr:FecR domain-containing protein [Roseibium suaedae]SHM74299.1 FecR family protein [Roseibium suaedae]
MSDSHEEHAGYLRASREARDWLVRLTSGAPSAADLESFKRWQDGSPQNRAAFEEERAFWTQIEHLASERRAVPGAPLSRRLFLGGSAMAAAVAVGVVAGPRILTSLQADFIAQVGEQRDVTLSDGTVATLNTGAALKVEFLPGLRLVHLLQGEAEFHVAPVTGDAPFRVAARGGNTEMRSGKVFVDSGDDLTTVAAVEGMASVFSPMAPDAPRGDFPGIEIETAQQTSYLRGAAPSGPVIADLESVLAWRAGRIVFDGKSFSAAVSVVGRYIAEPIIVRPGIDPSFKVSGVFSTAQPLIALQSIAKTQNLTVRRIPSVAIVLT